MDYSLVTLDKPDDTFLAASGSPTLFGNFEERFFQNRSPFPVYVIDRWGNQIYIEPEFPTGSAYNDPRLIIQIRRATGNQRCPVSRARSGNVEAEIPSTLYKINYYDLEVSSFYIPELDLVFCCDAQKEYARPPETVPDLGQLVAEIRAGILTQIDETFIALLANDPFNALDELFLQVFGEIVRIPVSHRRDRRTKDGGTLDIIIGGKGTRPYKQTIALKDILKDEAGIFQFPNGTHIHVGRSEAAVKRSIDTYCRQEDIYSLKQQLETAEESYKTILQSEKKDASLKVAKAEQARKDAELAKNEALQEITRLKTLLASWEGTERYTNVLTEKQKQESGLRTTFLKESRADKEDGAANLKMAFEVVKVVAAIVVPLATFFIGKKLAFKA